jgi:hypothetical protein
VREELAALLARLLASIHRRSPHKKENKFFLKKSFFLKWEGLF